MQVQSTTATKEKRYPNVIRSICIRMRQVSTRHFVAEYARSVHPDLYQVSTKQPVPTVHFDLVPLYARPVLHKPQSTGRAIGHLAVVFERAYLLRRPLSRCNEHEQRVQRPVKRPEVLVAAHQHALDLSPQRAGTAQWGGLKRRYSAVQFQGPAGAVLFVGA